MCRSGSRYTPGPKHCPNCGASSTDPQFDPPWDEEARPLWLAWKRDQSSENMKDFWEGQLLAWRYRDALRHHRPADAEDVRTSSARFLTGLADPSCANSTVSNLHSAVVLAALEFGQLDAAADELNLWLRESEFDGLLNDSGRRTNARMLLDGQLRFLGHPAGPPHAACGSIKADAREVATRAQDVLTPDHQARMYLLR